MLKENSLRQDKIVDKCSIFIRVKYKYRIFISDYIITF